MEITSTDAARTITLIPSRYNEPDKFTSSTVIKAHSRYAGHTVRMIIGYIGPDGSGRKVQGGPMVPGPWTYSVPLATVLDNHGGSSRESAEGIAAGTEYEAKPGDVFVMAGRRWVLTDDRELDYPTLTPVTD